jgi:acyl-CoA hydrolase
MRNAITPAAAAELVPDGASVIKAFMGVGSPHRVINALWHAACET